MAFGQQDDSSVPLPVIPLLSGATDNPNAPQSAVPPSSKTVKPFGTTPQKVDYDPNFPLLSKSKGFKEAMAKYEDVPGPDDSTLSKSVIMERQLNVMENSPLFAQSNSELRLRMQMAFWKQHVEPLGREDGHPVSLKEWLKARGDKWLETHPNPKISTSDTSKFGLAGGHVMISQAASAVDLINNIRQKFQNLKEQTSAVSAMMDAQLTPHMGPILLNQEHIEINKMDPKVPGMGMTLDELYQTSKYAQENYYQNTLKDHLLKGGGDIVGSIPSIYAVGGGLKAIGAEELLGLGKVAGKGINPTTVSLFGKFSGFASEVAKKSIYEGAQGYLIGSMDRESSGKKMAANFAVGSAAFGIVGGAGGKLLSQIRLWTSPKEFEALTDAVVKDYTAKAPETQVTPVAVALAGSEKQKITRAVVNAINEVSGGQFWTMPHEAQQQTLKLIARRFPEMASEAGMIDKHITEMQALKATAEWRQAMPEADAAMKKLEAIDGTPVSKTIADNIAKKETLTANQRIANYINKTDEVRAQIKAGTKVKPGGASAKSLEFSDNFSTHVDAKLDKLGLGKDKFTWESRGHKLLFYLNVLSSEAKAKGPSAARDKEAQFLMNQLHQEFPNQKLEDLIKMSDTLWAKIQKLEQAGQIKPGEPTRIWRQTHLGNGESPFAHEVDLLQKAEKAAAEGRKAKTVDQIKAEAKTTEKPKVKAPTETKTAKQETSPEMGSAMSAYVAALRKMGYSPQDIGRMTPAELAQIISQKIDKPATPAAAPAAKVMTEDEKLAAAFKKSGDAGTGKVDTSIHQQVMERLFPGQKYADLTPEEQSEVNQMAATLSKLRSKGK